MSIVCTSLRWSSHHVQIRLNHALALAVESSVVFVFGLVYSIVRCWPRNLLYILITLLGKSFRRLHVLVYNAFELVAAVYFGSRMLYLVKTLVAVLTWISNPWTLLLVLFASHISRSSSLLLFVYMHIVFSHWGHDISKIYFLGLNTLSLVESIRITHKLIDIIHFLRSTTDIVFGEIALTLWNTSHDFILIVFHINICLLVWIDLAFSIVLLHVDLLHVGVIEFVRNFLFVCVVNLMIIHILICRGCAVVHIHLLPTLHLLVHLVLVFVATILAALVILVLHWVRVLILNCVYHLFHLILGWLMILLSSFFLLLLHLTMVSAVCLLVRLQVIITSELRR